MIFLKIFFVTNIKIEIFLKIFFLKFSIINILFREKKLIKILFY